MHQSDWGSGALSGFSPKVTCPQLWGLVAPLFTGG